MDGDCVKDAVRSKINSIIESNETSEGLCEVGIYKWQNILNNFEEVFIKKPHYSSKIEWYWEHLKDSFSLPFPNNDAYQHLHELINNIEEVYFIVQETNSVPKFWIYEGRIKAIQNVIAKATHFEFYIISKKYEWLLCENHHCYLIGSGEEMVDKMKKILLR